MVDQNTKRILQKEFWSYKTNEEDGMAKSFAKFKSLIDRLAGVGVVVLERDKTNALLSSLPDHGKVSQALMAMNKIYHCIC